MEIVPILSALRRNKAGAVLVALQIALTLAVVANALPSSSIIGQICADPAGWTRQTYSPCRISGWGNPMTCARAPRRIWLRCVCCLEVVDAEATVSFPLSGNYLSGDIRLKTRQTTGLAIASLYFRTRSTGWRRRV